MIFVPVFYIANIEFFLPLLFFQEIILKRAADLAEALCCNIPRTPTQIYSSQYPPSGGPPPTTASGTHSMMIGQHFTAISPDGMTNGGTYVTITNPDGPTVVYGSSNPNSQQQRIVSSTDVNNNEVTISTSGTIITKKKPSQFSSTDCIFFLPF